MKIVILDSNSLGEGLDLSIFKDFGELEIYGFTGKDETIDRIREAEVIITNKVLLNESNLQHAKKVKLICVTATGSNNIDKAYAASAGITVCNVVNYSTECVAQHTFAMLFYLFEKLSYYDHYVKSGRYVNDAGYGHFEKQFHELNGKKWGIIGFGNIGKRVAEIATVFGCQVSYYSTSGKNDNSLYPRVDLKTLLQESDIVSIHAPLNENTMNLLTYPLLKLMKPTAYLLNLGRGGIVNEADLAKAIEEDLLEGVGLDVLSEEPMSEKSPFNDLKINHHKCLITPHIAWASIESRIRVMKEVYFNIEAYIKGEKRNVVLK